MLFLVGEPTKVKCEIWGISRKVTMPLASAGSSEPGNAQTLGRPQGKAGSHQLVPQTREVSLF